MKKALIFLLALLMITSLNYALASSIDTSYTAGITPFEWTPISDVDKVMQYENQKNHQTWPQLQTILMNAI